MKTYSIIAAVAAAAASLLAFSAPAAAQEAVYEMAQPIVVNKTRAEVQAELAQARANGPLIVSEGSDSTNQPATRAMQRRAAAPVVVAQTAPVAKGQRAELNMLKLVPHAFEGDTSFTDTAVAAAPARRL
jgi:hypothetical protein